MMKKTLFFLLFLLPVSLYAESFVLPPDTEFIQNAPSTYRIRDKDDFLQALSKFVLDPEIITKGWKNLPKIQAGDVLVLNRGAKGSHAVLELRSGRNVRLSPQVREISTSRVVPEIPLQRIQHFLNRPQLINPEETEDLPYIVSSTNAKVLLSTEDEIYVRNLFHTEQKEYAIIRPGSEYKSQDGSEVYAYEAVYLGDATLKAYDGEIATFKIVRASREIHKGDYLIPADNQEFKDSFKPTAPPPEAVAGAQIVSVLDGVNKVGQYQIVVVNRGEQDGISFGNILGIFQRGEEIVDSRDKETLTLPNHRTGTLLVFKAYDNVSYALVMKATNLIQLYDVVGLP